MRARIRHEAALAASLLVLATLASAGFVDFKPAPAITVSNEPCPEGMARVSAYWGSYCIDKYEAYNAGSGKAGSAAGQQPWVNVNWNGAKAACAAAGKRLCKDYEWMAACDLGGQKYDLTNEEDGEYYGCHTYGSGAVSTGSRAKCASAAGVADMVGNVFEWTDALVPDGSWSDAAGHPDGYVGELLGEGKAKYGDDYAVFPSSGGRGNAFLRGGIWYWYSDFSPRQGCFGLYLFDGPSFSDSYYGFRCCAG